LLTVHEKQQGDQHQDHPAGDEQSDKDWARSASSFHVLANRLYDLRQKADVPRQFS
jgi:hypothetical protein